VIPSDVALSPALPAFKHRLKTVLEKCHKFCYFVLSSFEEEEQKKQQQWTKRMMHFDLKFVPVQKLHFLYCLM